jgi:shikimate dehydrogenase
VRPWAEAASVVGAVEVVVATTPAGSTDALADEVGSAPSGLLFDVVYSPWPTRLAARWSELGGRVVGGLELLVEQAALQVQLMTGREAPVDVMRAAGRAALSGR